MKTVFRRFALFVYLLGAVSTIASAQTEPLSISIVPIGGSTVQGGQEVAVEVYVTAHRNIRLEGGQVDLPCTLGGGQDGTIIAQTITTDPDDDGLRGPSSTGVPFLFGPGGLGPVNMSSCLMVAAPFVGGGPITLKAGVSRYLCTLTYAVSECASGEFQLAIEGVGVPPSNADLTRFREDNPPGPAPGPTVPIRVVESSLMVPTGRCCRLSSCLGDSNEHCCLMVHEGTGWTSEASCPNGCPCEAQADCDDEDGCTNDACVDGFCTFTPVDDGTTCDDGLFCTTADRCSGGTCSGSGVACPGRRCNETIDACVQCLESSDCADANPCTNDICNAAGNCVRDFNTELCDDGRFCTEDDRCSRGRCIGELTTCTGQFCNETLDRCVSCEEDAHCDDSIEATVDRCVAGNCEHVAGQKASLSLIPVGGALVEGGSVVRVEAFVTALVNVRFEGGQIDLPCSFSGGTGGSIIAQSGTSDPDEDGARGPSSNGVAFLFGAGGLGPFDPVNCRFAAVPGPGQETVTVAAGQSRYLGTIEYLVSDCALGAFQIGFEGVGDPPDANNSTRFREDDPPGPAPGTLLALAQEGLTLTIPEGRCCAAGQCLGMVNQHCCLDVLSGGEWDRGVTCADGCACTSNEHCSDDNGCTLDRCVATICTHEAVPDGRPCHDDIFCTATDMCQEGVCVGAGERCPAEAPLCDEKNDRCVECRRHSECDDGNACTTDRCDALAGVCVHENNSKPCNDGLFCTKPDVCTDGICVGTPRRCPIGQTCSEELDRCIP